MRLAENAGKNMLQVRPCLVTLAAVLAQTVTTHWRMMSCKCVCQLSYALNGMTIASNDCYGASADAHTF